MNVPEEVLENVSDSEQTAMQSAEEIQAKLQMQTKRQLEFLIKQIDSTNQTLCNVKQRLAENAEKTVDFIEKINN